jgi:hypothetical protein
MEYQIVVFDTQSPLFSTNWITDKGVAVKIANRLSDAFGIQNVRLMERTSQFKQIPYVK